MGYRPPAPGACAQWAVGPYLVVLDSPSLDHDPCFLRAVEDLPVQELDSELAAMAPIMAVLPRAARFDIEF